ncbi:MAG TPA: hypothetical protein VNL35_16065 [Chloroflexota bacterium]|nr:hypothetical protein [Chloroflexota bacterium]
MSIGSAEEFTRLRTSSDPAEYHRAAHEEASLDVWLEVIRDFPEMRFWAAQNKTIPIEILEILCHDIDSRVRHMVASKRKIPHDLQSILARDTDASIRRALAHNARVAADIL